MEKIQKQLREAQEADDREAVAQLRRDYGQARNQQRTVFAKLVMGPEFEVKSLYGNGGNIYTKNDQWKGYSSQVYRASNYKLLLSLVISFKSLVSLIVKLQTMQTSTLLLPRLSPHC